MLLYRVIGYFPADVSELLMSHAEALLLWGRRKIQAKYNTRAR